MILDLEGQERGNEVGQETHAGSDQQLHPQHHIDLLDEIGAGGAGQSISQMSQSVIRLVGVLVSTQVLVLLR